MNRRTFLKLAGAGSVAFAAGCSPESPQYLYSQVQAPDDMVTGKSTWYASTCRECPAGCGVLARNREGRVVKLEGNPGHPVNRGKLCMRGQAALQAVYHPERLKTPLLRDGDGFKPIRFDQAIALLKSKAQTAARNGADRVRVLTETVGESRMALFQDVLAGWNSGGPVVFEPFGYEALKAANRDVFGVDGLVSYRLEEADLLLSFGAEFLETWLSPVEYAWKFKAMHAVHGGAKGIFFHASPYQGLTGANADHWLACAPGSEAALALGLVRQLLDVKRGAHLPAALRALLEDATAPYTQEAVLQRCGIPLKGYERLVVQLVEARRPLVLGAGCAMSEDNGLRTNIAANLLNLMLDPQLARIDAVARHRVETAARRVEVLALFTAMAAGRVEVAILNNVNPAFALPPGSGVGAALSGAAPFVVGLTAFMDETAALCDLVLPVRLPLETWDEYGGRTTLLSTLQPAMGRLGAAPHLTDVLLEAGSGPRRPGADARGYLAERLLKEGRVRDEAQWVDMLRQGGIFETVRRPPPVPAAPDPGRLASALADRDLGPPSAGLAFAAAPSVRLFDGRGANRPWLSEIPEPLSRVAWQSPVFLHPETARANELAQGDIVRLETEAGALEAPAYPSEVVRPGTLMMPMGQGHTAYGRYAAGVGANPVAVLPERTASLCGGAGNWAFNVTLRKTGRALKLAHVDGSRIQHGRPFALTVTLAELGAARPPAKAGLTMDRFPLTLPLPEGYDPRRDFYPAHDHDHYRWGMVVDLDRCVGCGACAAACYAENNVGIVGEQRIREGREMAWLSVERYHDERRMQRVMFLPMLCQHCDNAPCEAVCPVYAPHHSAEGLNNQIYNRCIGTRFCSQNCPYKVRRFNWFTWEWPEPLNLQLNPDVTVRSKGVMEKCSFCIQRIKEARTVAKNEDREIRDGEIAPACVQTCPTDALVFGNLNDPQTRVRKLVNDPRAYQALGYLNTKPAVIYLKKVLHAV
jgi:molybdopterin-containing oxidoreductase family iron-sulfur binding subunit